jgi:hypothetical protein
MDHFPQWAITLSNTMLPLLLQFKLASFIKSLAPDVLLSVQDG